MTSSSRKQFGIERSFSVASSSPTGLGWFREPTTNWSPKSDDCDQSLNSDDENHVAMETDCYLSSENSQTELNNRTFTLNAPTFPNTIISLPDVSPSVKNASSKSLFIGRPARSVGLKDVDLTRNTRAEEIRRAKQTNKGSTGARFSPIRQNSSPAMFNYRCRDHKSPNERYFPMIGQSRDSSNTDLNTEVKPNLCIAAYDQNSVRNRRKHKSKASHPPPSLYSMKCDEVKESGTNWINQPSATEEIKMIEIDDENPLPSPLLNHENVTKRKPRKKQVGSPKWIPFSDEEDNDDNLKHFSKKDTSKRASHVPSHSYKTDKKHSLVSLILGLFIITFGAIAIMIYLHVNPHGLCIDSEFKYNLTGLESDLKQEFYGQHLAMRVLLSSLKGYSQFTKRQKPLVLSLHGWTGTGKNFVTGIIAKHVFKQGTDSKFIHKFIIPLHFPHVSEVALYRQQLKDWIIGNITKCSKGGLFIFDEVDKIPPGVMTVLKPFLDPKGSSSKNLYLKNVIFLFLSNTGGKLINNYVIESYKKGLPRENIELIQLEHLLHSYADANPTTWYRELMTSGAIDHFVPFLPLENTHVKQCVRKDLRAKGFIVLETMVTEIANEMTYFPEDLELFSVSGCKKVSSKVDVAMG